MEVPGRPPHLGHIPPPPKKKELGSPRHHPQHSHPPKGFQGGRTGCGVAGPPCSHGVVGSEEEPGLEHGMNTQRCPGHQHPLPPASPVGKGGARGRLLCSLGPPHFWGESKETSSSRAGEGKARALELIKPATGGEQRAGGVVASHSPLPPIPNSLCKQRHGQIQASPQDLREKPVPAQVRAGA